MRGLIKKDCYVMKDFKKVLLIMILMVVFFLAMEPTNVSFVLGYMTVCGRSCNQRHEHR